MTDSMIFTHNNKDEFEKKNSRLEDVKLLFERYPLDNFPTEQLKEGLKNAENRLEENGKRLKEARENVYKKRDDDIFPKNYNPADDIKHYENEIEATQYEIDYLKNILEKREEENIEAEKSQNELEEDASIKDTTSQTPQEQKSTELTKQTDPLNQTEQVDLPDPTKTKNDDSAKQKNPVNPKSKDKPKPAVNSKSKEESKPESKSEPNSKQKNNSPYAYTKEERRNFVSMFGAEYFDLEEQLEVLNRKIESDKSVGNDKVKKEEYNEKVKESEELKELMGMKAFSIIANCLEQFEGVDENGKKLEGEKLEEAKLVKFLQLRDAIKDYDSAILESKKEKIINKYIETLGSFADLEIPVGDKKYKLGDFIKNNFDSVKNFIRKNKLDYVFGDNKVVGTLTDKFKQNRGINLRNLNNFMNMQYSLKDEEKSYGGFVLDTMKDVLNKREENYKLEKYDDYLNEKWQENREITKDNTRTIVSSTLGLGGAATLVALPIFPIALIVLLIGYCSYADKEKDGSYKNPIGSLMKKLKEKSEEVANKIDEKFKELSNGIYEDEKKLYGKIRKTLIDEREKLAKDLVKTMKDAGLDKLPDSLSEEQITFLNRCQDLNSKYTMNSPKFKRHFGYEYDNEPLVNHTRKTIKPELSEDEIKSRNAKEEDGRKDKKETKSKDDNMPKGKHIDEHNRRIAEDQKRTNNLALYNIYS